VALLALRRFRHLIIAVIVAQLLTTVIYDLVGPIARRPRPFGVAIQAGWGGWALPSVQVASLAATLVVVLYTLVPEGRWRQRGKLVAPSTKCRGPEPGKAERSESRSDGSTGLSAAREERIGLAVLGVALRWGATGRHHHGAAAPLSRGGHIRRESAVCGPSPGADGTKRTT
jgi:hypothetical protein